MARNNTTYSYTPKGHLYLVTPSLRQAQYRLLTSRGYPVFLHIQIVPLYVQSKRVLNLNKEDDPEEENITWEDEIEKEISRRSRQKNISYFAFTATPKPKTLEVFG